MKTIWLYFIATDWTSLFCSDISKVYSYLTRQLKESAHLKLQLLV